jgi:hypothetical protein
MPLEFCELTVQWMTVETATLRHALCKQEAPEELLLESSHCGAQAFVALAKDQG